MGRGRAKAKQTKVARELKYNAPNTDLSALERELHSATTYRGVPRFVDTDAVDDTDDVEDDLNEADDGEDDDYEKWAARR